MTVYELLLIVKTTSDWNEVTDEVHSTRIFDSRKAAAAGTMAFMECCANGSCTQIKNLIKACEKEAADAITGGSDLFCKDKWLDPKTEEYTADDEDGLYEEGKEPYTAPRAELYVHLYAMPVYGVEADK